MIDLEEGVIYAKIPTCLEDRITNFYMYRQGTLYCRSRADKPWRSSILQVREVLPWLVSSIPDYLRVSEGL